MNTIEFGVKLDIFYIHLSHFVTVKLELKMNLGFFCVLGVQKERMVEDDMYVLASSGEILFSPLQKGYPHKPPKCSDCAPLFMKVFIRLNSGFLS